MKRIQIAAMAMLAISVTNVSAANSSAKVDYDSAKKAAAVRYAEDRKLCADETTSSVRMQCLRDAKSEYSASLKVASESYKKAKASATVAPSPRAVSCPECGKVTAIRVVEQKGESTPLGMIAGGVAGAVLGHQVGGGRGQDVATLAGAVGGAYAGHKVEEHLKTTKSWVVSVHFEDGTDREYSFPADPGYAATDAVKISGNSIIRR